MAGPVWRFYEAPGGGRPVERDIEAAFKNNTRGKVRLRGLMERIAADETLPGDVKDLGGGLLEARLSHDGCEFRLFYTRCSGGLVLLAVHFAPKKGRTVPRAISLARKRLADAARKV